MSIRGQTAIVGFSEVPTLRNYGERDTLGLMAEVARGSITDAGLRKEDIDGLICPESVNSLELSEGLGITPRYTASMTVHGASGATSILTAAMAVHTGIANYVLCVFGESRPQSSSRLAAGTNPRGGGGPAGIITEWEAPYGSVIAANGGYGMIKSRHMFEYGTTQEQFAKIAVNQRFNALKNPNAVFKDQPITVDDVLNSRFINEPMHILESVMPCGGAAACIVTTAERARSLPNPPVYILGAAAGVTDHDILSQAPNITTTPVVISARKAYEMAGYGPKDMEYAQFYD